MQLDELLAYKLVIAYILSCQHTQKPYPYGDCNLESNDTMAECTGTCLDRAKAETCNCTAPHMGSYKQSDYLPMMYSN